MAGYNIRLLPIIQSIAQLESVYGREDSRTMITNHALQILYAPREQKDANEYSEMLGYETFKAKSISKQRGKSGINESTSDQRRALLLPQEIKEIGQWKEIIILENTKPILCDKIKYYEEDVFKKRIQPPPDVPLLDMDTHLAKISQQERLIKVDDIKDDVIQLDKLKIRSDKLLQLREGLENDISVEDAVNTFFAVFEDGIPMNNIEENDDYDVDSDGISQRPSPEEMAELEANPDAHVNSQMNEEVMALSDEERALMISTVSSGDTQTDGLLDLSVLEKPLKQ